MGESLRPVADPETDGRAGADGAVGLLALAARVLATHRTEALARWVWRLEQRPAAQPWPDVGLSDVLEDVPALIEAVLAMLDGRSPDSGALLLPETAARLRRQTAFRLLQGAPLAAVLNEQALLRDELWALLARRLPVERRPAELLALARALDGALQCVFESCLLLSGAGVGEERRT